MFGINLSALRRAGRSGTLPLRFPFLPALLLLIAIGCAPHAEELLPIPASVKGANLVSDVEITFRRQAPRAVAAIDAKAGAAAEPFAELLERSIREATREAGLTSGRALKLLVEVDALQTADAASAFVGRDDRLEGSVYVRDAATGESLGQLYIDIDRNNGGLIGAVSRIGNVRESLARQFGSEVARALGGRMR
jgi:hypothetical protein